MSQPSSYAFGDTDTAAVRLRLVAETFAEPSRQLLETVRERHSPTLAVDLGCGPGHSTELVHAATQARRTVGLDASEAFLRHAAARASAGVSYRQHDARVVPFPTGPADLIYCRLLLAHLPDPPALVKQWATQLAPGGLLILDEIEYMHTDNPVLVRYEEMVVAVVAARGGAMYAGPLLADLTLDAECQVVSDRVVPFDVPVPTAARMYSLNLTTWRDDRSVAARWTSNEVDDVAGGLTHLTSSTTGESVHWGLRQIVLR